VSGTLPPRVAADRRRLKRVEVYALHL